MAAASSFGMVDRLCRFAYTKPFFPYLLERLRIDAGFIIQNMDRMQSNIANFLKKVLRETPQCWFYSWRDHMPRPSGSSPTDVRSRFCIFMVPLDTLLNTKLNA